MRRATAALSLAATSLLVMPSASGRDWYVAAGGDRYRSGFNPEETAPYFVSGAPVTQPNPEWVTKLSDFPSGNFLAGGPVVAEGLVMIGGGSTNSIVALDQETGLPAWRFQPDPRGSRALPGDGYTGAYPGLNHPWYDDGVLYATFSNGVLYALDAGSGERIWRWEVPPAGAPGEVTDHTLDPKVEWDYDNPAHRRFPLRAEVAPFTGDYPKFHSGVNYCIENDRVVVDTLDARIFVIDAKTGETQWHRYYGAPDWPGEFVWPEQAQGGVARQLAHGSRRYEARGGSGCTGGHILLPGEDGFLKVFEEDTGRFVGAYDAFHPGDLGFAYDIGGGLQDPKSGDLIINTLSNRMVRLSFTGMRPRWRHTEDGGVLSLCDDRADRSTCEAIVTTEDGKQDGPLGSAVFGGIMALDYERRVIANANQDGHLYFWKDIDVTGENPTLYAAIPAGRNPWAKRRPRPDSISHYLPDDGKHAPWVRRTAALEAVVMGGGVAYFPATWEHAIYGVQYLAGGRVLDEPRVVFRYEVRWDDEFPYPPFGETEPEPIVDVDLLTMTAPALIDGHLYFAANDGSVYSFDLHDPTADTQRNLAILGSGVVPFIPRWDQARGSFDHVWTPADWYKSQVPPSEGWRLPTPAGMVPIGLPVAALALWARWRGRKRPAPQSGGRWWSGEVVSR
jgi:outer membrane protein assembly factor BamB